jgi:uncharacterized protein YabN with tetrapyrrole methylase and pyrophosphatase domain
MKKLPHLDKNPENECDWFSALANMTRYLRSPQGCPWDQKQTATSFGEHAKGELDEYLEALASGKLADIEEEFGDTLFVLLASAAAAEAEFGFDLGRALEAAHEKMVRRHEHVFGENRAATPEDAMRSWNEIKAAEKAKKKGASSC